MREKPRDSGSRGGDLDFTMDDDPICVVCGDPVSDLEGVFGTSDDEWYHQQCVYGEDEADEDGQEYPAEDGSAQGKEPL